MIRSSDKTISTNTFCHESRRRRGFILLVLVMAMAVLSLLAIEFQAESALQLRMSSHRQDVIQCEYALESGLAAAGKLIQEYHEEMLRKIRNPQPTVSPESSLSEKEAKEQLEKIKRELGLDKLEGLTDEPNEPNTTDPNSPELTDDPNATLGMAPPEWKDHLLKQVTVEVGKAQAEIFIYGENYKLPLIWAMQSPFAGVPGSKSGGLGMVRDLLTNLEVDAARTNEVMRYLGTLTQDMEVPYCPTMIKRADRWIRSGKSYTNEQVNLLTIKNHMLFSSLGAQWFRDVNDERYPEFKEMLTLSSNNLISDYLGLWGAIRININTAPAEVLAAGFKSVGLTMDLAEKIVATRNEKGLYRSPILIREIPGLEEIYTAIYPMADVIDHVYTVKIVARSGEVTETKSACFYRLGKKLEILAVF
ncbi:MAG: general secretion pathway protein GspK [Sedimentisphaerales bacterium]|nr:general secretion pathway protein GspK [Sedimentisphaerales bacterium]MBN2842400.1 general secretion pathway protein GspK [Sedimentisphaerales bacterium]